MIRSGSLTGSLRARLVASMSAVAVASLAAVTLLHAAAEDGDGPLGRISAFLLGDELPEPWQDLAILLPFSVLVVVLVSLVTVWNLRSLTQASAEAARVGPRNPHARIATAGLPSEVAPLVDAVNGALDRMALAYENERRFTADAAHELRTPLASLKLRLQRARTDGRLHWEEIGHDLGQMERLVSQLLELARKEAARPDGATDPYPPINLARVARLAAVTLLPLVEASARRLVVELDEDLTVRGDGGDLQDLLRNLLENALVHGEGSIRLTGRRSAVCGETPLVRIEVADDGAGIPPESRDAMFERFRKGRASAPGSGLGLAIVRAVARAHRATVRIGDGPGCRVIVELPACLPAAEARAGLSVPAALADVDVPAIDEVTVA